MPPGVKFSPAAARRIADVVRQIERQRPSASGRSARFVTAVRPTVFLVRVTQDGGADGTNSTPATWTYTVQTIGGDLTLGTGIGMVFARPNGKVTAGSTYGLAMFDPPGGETIKLWDAGERPGTGGC